MYIIKCNSNLHGYEMDRYYSISDIHNYPFWTEKLSQAKMFASVDEILALLKSDAFTKRSNVRDKYNRRVDLPPTILHNASGVCFRDPEADLTITIQEIVVTDVFITQQQVVIKWEEGV